MGRKCVVPTCSTEQGPNSTTPQVHRFPSPASSSDQLKLWIQAVFQQSTDLSHFEGKIRNGGVCSSHFLPNDYRNWNDGLNPLFHKLGRLKPNVFPSQNLSRNS